MDAPSPWSNTKVGPKHFKKGGLRISLDRGTIGQSIGRGPCDSIGSTLELTLWAFRPARSRIPRAPPFLPSRVHRSLDLVSWPVGHAVKSAEVEVHMLTYKALFRYLCAKDMYFQFDSRKCIV